MYESASRYSHEGLTTSEDALEGSARLELRLVVGVLGEKGDNEEGNGSILSEE